MDSRVGILDGATGAPEVTLMRFLKLRGRTQKEIFFAVEGHDDVTFYQTIANRVNPGKSGLIAYFNCKGKENVLNLIPLLEENAEIQIERVWFFVDRDFDDLRGREGHNQLWMTPTYSFENLLVSERILESLLEGEFRCHDYEGTIDIANIKEKFKKLLSDYRKEMFVPNLCAYYSVKHGIKLHPQDDTITPNLSVHIDFLKLRLTVEEILQIMPKNEPLTVEKLECVRGEFQELSPVQRWRGKFLFVIFTKFISELKQDRGSSAPVYFSARGRMSFSPANDTIRALASMVEIPEGLTAVMNRL